MLFRSNITAVGVAASAANQGAIGAMVGASAGAGVFASGNVTFTGWDSPHSTSLGHTFLSQALGNLVANFFAQYGGGIYFNTGPYTSLTIIPQTGNFVAGSDFQIEGVM